MPQTQHKMPNSSRALKIKQFVEHGRWNWHWFSRNVLTKEPQNCKKKSKTAPLNSKFTDSYKKKRIIVERALGENVLSHVRFVDVGLLSLVRRWPREYDAITSYAMHLHHSENVFINLIHTQPIDTQHKDWIYLHDQELGVQSNNSLFFYSCCRRAFEYTSIKDSIICIRNFWNTII